MGSLGKFIISNNPIQPYGYFIMPWDNQLLTFKTVFTLAALSLSHAVYEVVTQGVDTIPTLLALSIVTTIIVAIAAVLFSYEKQSETCKYGFTGCYGHYMVPIGWVIVYLILWLGQLWDLWAFIPDELVQFWAISGLAVYVVLALIVTTYSKSSMNIHMCKTHKKFRCQKCVCKPHRVIDCGTCYSPKMY